MIPTAEEFLKNKPFMRDDLECDTNYQLMIEFAKLHVEAALKAAAENIRTRYTQAPIGEGELNIIEYVDKNSILNAYPLTNIK